MKTMLPPNNLIPYIKPLRPLEHDPKETCAAIITVLENLGLYTQLRTHVVGPHITHYEFTPPVASSWDAAIQKNSSSQTNYSQTPVCLNSAQITLIKRSLCKKLNFKKIRILESDGKTPFAVEVPHAYDDWIIGYNPSFREILDSSEWENAKQTQQIPIIFGRDIYNKPIIADLAQMPHLLTTASGCAKGQTECNLSIGTSLLFSQCPTDTYVLIFDKHGDYKLIESIPHTLGHCMHDSHEALLALRWLTDEMANRLKILTSAKVHNIGQFNALPQVTRQTLFNDSGQTADKLVRIVYIIEELSSLVAISKMEVENNFKHLLAQAAAAGIHLIVSTIRPYQTYLSLEIYEKFPAKIFFETICSQDGEAPIPAMAQDLMPFGDMIYNFDNPNAFRRGMISQGITSSSEFPAIIKFFEENYCFEKFSHNLFPHKPHNSP